MKNKYVIGLSVAALLAVAAFFVFFRIKRVKKAYLAKDYDHFINGLVLKAGEYMGYVEIDEPDLITTTGSQYSAALPREDVTLKDGWIIERRA